jgi:UDP-N-acetyl-D-galactosamine dehydrogenase
MGERIGVVGLGYVGLPVAIAFARTADACVGFDIDERRIAELNGGRDRTREVAPDELAAARVTFTTNPAALSGCTMIVVTVPTPIDKRLRPDLTSIVAASRTVGRALRRGAVVVYESTVYPGLTEDVCLPILEAESGLRLGVDFGLGYAPERINPGDKDHTVDRIVRVVSASDDATLARVEAAYASITQIGVHRAPSIKVAEAAKVIENAQRDLNIAFMNECALIFDRIGIRTADVLAAAGTKWNFVRFAPGLVGGHCIGVDPYYLTDKAEALGYHPEVILAGRRTNNSMGRFAAQKLIRRLATQRHSLGGARVAVLGLSFKENVPDLRNSLVPTIVDELRGYGIDALVHDPEVDADEAMHEYGLSLAAWESLTQLDGIILAVPHRKLAAVRAETWASMLVEGGVFIDVKSALHPSLFPPSIFYWSL